MESDHFILKWNKSDTSIKEIDEAKIFIELVYDQYSKLFGKQNLPTKKIEVRFGGNGLSDGGKVYNIPRVDVYGVIYLYRFPRVGYLEPFPHELIHAIRINSVPMWEPFFEEGFASVISTHFFPIKKGFPFFGYDNNKIAAYLFFRDDFIPLKDLRLRHGEINYNCMLQSYILRESFFQFLKDRFGLEKLIKFSYSKNVGELELYNTVWKKDFATLITDWERHFSIQYNKEGIMQYGSAFIENTPAKHQHMCTLN